MKWLQAAADEIVGVITLMLESRDRKTFTVGIGRSGFVARGFALRLMNLGFKVYFLGER